MSNKLIKLFAGLLALGALALGGSAIAGATSGNNTEATAEQSEAAEPAEEGEAAEKGDSADEGDSEESGSISAADASRARDAAAAKTGGQPGHVELDGEHGATYEVEVTKTDGSQVDVRLDDQFQVVIVDPDNETGEHHDD
jgi:uncharacterized membrane protein YkoI